MPAPYHILDIDAGETYNTLSIQYTDDSGTPQDLTGYSGEMAVRFEEDGPLVFSVSTAGGGMTINESTGYVYFNIPASKTALMCPNNVDTKPIYDVWLTTPSGDKDPLAFGDINARARIVRP